MVNKDENKTVHKTGLTVVKDKYERAQTALIQIVVMERCFMVQILGKLFFSLKYHFNTQHALVEASTSDHSRLPQCSAGKSTAAKVTNTIVTCMV